MSEIFISYARSTEAEAKRIVAALVEGGFTVWRDDEIPAHRAYAEVISERLRAAKAVLVLWSAEAARSEWVRSEAERARGERKLVQLSLDGTELPMPFDQIQCADLRGWTGEQDHPGWRRVAESLAQLAGPGAPRGTAAETAGRPLSAPSRVSVCVLPFANMSGDPEQEYFSDGISEDIITDLSKVAALSVVARNTAFTFKGRSLAMPQIAAELGVTHVLEGSVRKAGGRVRITAQLIDGKAGDHVWAERYDRELTDIFALQDEISEAIVTALRLRLAPEEKKAIEARGTDSAEAYDLYLMARRHRYSGNIGDIRSERVVARLYARAVEIDPGYARAWAQLAQSQWVLRFRRGEVGPDGLEAADKAIALDPALADGYASKAGVLMDLAREDEARDLLERAIVLDPNSETVHEVAGSIFYVWGDFVRARESFAKVAEANETNFSAAGMLVSVELALGDEGAARRAATLTVERAEKALIRDPNNGYARGLGVGALALLGRSDRAREWIDRALLVDPDNRLMRYNFACTLALQMKDANAALAMLAAAQEGDVTTNWLNGARTDPDLASLRDDPRFEALLVDVEARLAAAASGTRGG